MYILQLWMSGVALWTIYERDKIWTNYSTTVFQGFLPEWSSLLTFKDLNIKIKLYLQQNWTNWRSKTGKTEILQLHFRVYISVDLITGPHCYCVNNTKLTKTVYFFYLFFLNLFVSLLVSNHLSCNLCHLCCTSTKVKYDCSTISIYISWQYLL